MIKTIFWRRRGQTKIVQEDGELKKKKQITVITDHNEIKTILAEGNICIRKSIQIKQFAQDTVPDE